MHIISKEKMCKTTTVLVSLIGLEVVVDIHGLLLQQSVSHFPCPQ